MAIQQVELEYPISVAVAVEQRKRAAELAEKQAAIRRAAATRFRILASDYTSPAYDLTGYNQRIFKCEGLA